MLGYHCGLRLGEVFGLCWDDIDFEAGTLTVNQQIQEINKHWTFTQPKYESYRTMRIDSTLLSVLQEAQAIQNQSQVDYGDFYTHLYKNETGAITSVETSNPVFPVNIRENGAFIQPRVTQHLCSVAHKELGMPDFDFHSLRYTHATMLIEAGISPTVVQERLGHKNIQTTLDIYADVTDHMRDVAGDVIDEIYSK
ncbi:MAG: site-specific integrase [Eubacteriales bacterium]|nr:site-specific integrase [Eubacteriales bacterium]